MNFIKLFFLQLYIVYRLFSGKSASRLIFSDNDGDEPTAGKAASRLGLQVLESEPGSPSGLDEALREPGEAGETVIEPVIDAENDSITIAGKSYTGDEFGEYLKSLADDATIKYDGKQYTGKEFKEFYEESITGEGGTDGGTAGKDGEETVKLGGKDITKSEYNKIYEEAKKRFGDKFDSLDDEVKLKLLEDRLEIRNEKRNIDKGHQVQAAKDEDLLVREEDIDRQVQALDRAKQEFEEKKAAYKKIIDEYPDKIEREDDDDKRDDLKADLRDARKEMDRLNKKITMQDPNFPNDPTKTVTVTPEKAFEIQDYFNQLEIQTNLYIKSRIALFRDFADDFKTTIPLEDIKGKLDAAEDVDPVDEAVYEKFETLWDRYMKKTPEYRAKFTLADYYRRNRDAYPVIKTNGQAGKDKGKDKGGEKVTSMKDFFNKLKSKQGGTPGVAPPGEPGAMKSKDKKGESETQKKIEKNTKSRLIGAREEEP